MDDIVFIGDWIKDRELGSGTFGIVTLWKHKTTDEKLAIKSCKWGDELTEKHKERWTKEVEMLQNCNNPNIVGTKQMPPEFVAGLARANPSGLPILCMEYCSGGDLRQLLNKPENCAGLKEAQVRQILSDVRNAMQFLHQNKITHRDLKPENVVMHVLDSAPVLNNIGVQNQGQKKVTYKLIDLGYAKEIDSNSICASFVGTLQYLAPEILYSKTYSNSVDYWSLGLLAFEIICGVRPFLPFMAPVQWMPFVKKKTHENICVYETFHGDIEYSDEIFPENNVSKPFKILIEKWLRTALEWDPKLRGRDAPSKVTFNIPSEDKTTASKVVIFDNLEQTLSKKILKIFSVATISYLAYEINDTTPISNLKKWIKKDTQIPLVDQILVSRTAFVEIGNEDVAAKYWNEDCNVMLFLYNKNNIINDNVEPIVPKAIQRCLEHPKTLYNYKNRKHLYNSGFYFVMSQMEIYDSLVNGIYARAEAIKHESKQLLLKHNTVDKTIGQLQAKEESIVKMTEIGKKHVLKLKENGVGTNLLGGFEKSFSDIEDLIDKTNKLQSAWSQLSVRVQSAFRRSNETLSADLNNFISKYNYQIISTNALKTFITHRRNEASSSYRSEEKQCRDIIKICYDCLKLRNEILLELRHQPFILKLKDLSTESSKIAEIISNASENTDILMTRSSIVLDQLTNCTWSTISILVNDADHLSDVPYSVISFQKSDFKIGEPVSNHCIKPVNKVDEDERLKSLVEESLKLRQNQMHLMEKLNLQKNLLKNSLDFNFLNEN